MAISHLIAHRIQRLDPGSAAQLGLRDQEIPLSGKVEECAREMKLSYVKKLGKIHGRFSNDFAKYPVSSWLKECSDEKMSYVSLTKQAMKQFKLALDTGEALIDAFVFFVQESFEHTDEMYIYVVQHLNAQYFDGDLQLTDALYLDTQHLLLAAKINLREWQDDDTNLNYLSILTWRGEKDLSDAFVESVGFTDKADIKEDTENFLEAVESYTQTLPEEQAFETREKIVEYCLEQDKAGERVVIADLSSRVNEEEQNAFEHYVFNEKPQLKKELVPDRGQLRQYIRISGRDELLSMSFDAKCLGENIVYDTDSDSLTIHKIPNALKSRLLKHLSGVKS